MPPPSTTIINAGDSIYALSSSTIINQLLEEFNEYIEVTA